MAISVTRFLPGIMATLLLTAGLHPAEALAADTPQASGLRPHWEESGLASWYGPRFEGRRTSSGEIFSQYALTAAHDSLPLGTRILVTTQETGRSVVVTVTDRMPPKHTRVIDLSRAAAKAVGIVNTGVGMVTLSAASEAPAIEVAEATDDNGDELSPPRRGPRHRRHAARTASAHRSYYHARSATLAQR